MRTRNVALLLKKHYFFRLEMGDVGEKRTLVHDEISSSRASNGESSSLYIVATERSEVKRWARFGKAMVLCGVAAMVVSLVMFTKTAGSPPPIERKRMVLGRQRWGIVGLGRIAYDFAACLDAHGGRLEAVAAGSLPQAEKRAAEFAKKFGVPRHYGSYEELAADPDIDVVYVATTNQLHRDTALVFIRAGKHVLVEKPTALNSEEALEMLREARSRGLLLATNFWNMAFPSVRWALDDVVAANAVGEILAVRGDMGFEAVYDLQDRFLSPKLGGGAVLDMGCYIVHYFVQVVAKNCEFLKQTLPTRPTEAYVFTPETIKQPFQSAIESEEASMTSLGNAGIRVFATGHVNKNVDAHAGLDSEEQKPVDVEASAAIDFAGIRLLLGTSLQRESPFTVQTLGAHGIVYLDAPANCPETAHADIFQDANYPEHHVRLPCCGQPVVESLAFAQPLDPYPEKYRPERYPNGMGFVYMMARVEECLSRANESEDSPPCLDLDIVPAWTQLATQQIVDEIIRQIRETGDVF